MRAHWYTLTSTMKQKGWWKFALEFGIHDRYLSISGCFWYTYWCAFVRWDGR